VNSAVVNGVGSSGPVVIVVSGAVVSGGSTIDHTCCAGVSSTTPSGLFARTVKTWLPTPRPESSTGDVQAANGSVSSAHSNVTPALVDENSKYAVVSVVGLSGATSRLMLVSGGDSSTTSQP
jgi:hypothetical protein